MNSMKTATIMKMLGEVKLTREINYINTDKCGATSYGEYKYH